MPQKRASSQKRTSSKKKASEKARSIKLQPASVELKPNELIIRFDHPHQVLPKLLELAHHFSESYIDLLSESVPTVDVLGGARARLIVSFCAHSTAWTATIAELGLNPLIFRNCVAAGVNNAGYVPPTNIPASPDTRLIDVVAAIQGAPHK